MAARISEEVELEQRERLLRVAREVAAATSARDHAIRDAYLAGMSVRKIADEVGLSSHRVRQIVRG